MDDDSPAVRVAEVSDYADVARCMAAFRDFLGDDTPTESQLAVGAYHALANDLAEYLLVGEPAHSYVQLRYVWSAWHLKDLCWVEDVFVDARHRGKGVGYVLMQAAIDRASQRGCHRLQLDANERNEAGAALYANIGFTHTSAWWDGGKDLYWVLSLE
ncbi:MAG: GNAT family N-acetyltransferase [Actinomycetota bacterium]